MNQLNASANLPDIHECGTLEALEAQSVAISMAIAKKKKEKEVISKFGKPFQSLKKDRKGNLVVYYRVDYRDETGKRQQCCSVSWDTLIDKLYLKLDACDPEQLAPNATIRDAYEKFIKKRKELVESGAISSQTAGYDVSNWNRFFSECAFVDKPIRMVATYQLEQEYRKICGDGTKYTQEAFNKAKTLMNGIYFVALSDGIIPINYAANVSTNLCKFIIKDLPEEAEQDKYYSQEEVQKLREYIRVLPKETMSLGILLHTYLVTRVGETRALTWDDYDPETGVMQIRHEIIQKEINGKNRSDYDAPYTKGHRPEGRRKVALPEEAMEVVEELRKINGSKKYLLHASRKAKFSIQTNKINAKIKEYCEACGITYHSSHKFRFYGITRMYETGVDEDVIQYTAGHCNPDMTRHYDKSRKKNKMASREAMSAL